MEKKSYIKSIGFQLVFTMLLVVLLGIGITAGASIIIAQSIISDESLAGVRQNTECEAVNMNGWLTQQIAAIDTLANVLAELDDFSSEQQASIFKSVLDKNDACFEVYMGYPNGEATTGSGYVFDYAGGWSAPARGWYKLSMTDTARTHVTTPYVDSQTNELCITVCRAVYRNGELLGVVSADIFVTTLYDMVMGTTLNQSGYAMLLNTNGDILVHPDKNFMPDTDGNYRSLADIEDSAYTGLWNKIPNASDTAIKYKDSSGVVQYYTVTTLESTGWFLITVLPVRVVNQHITTVITTIILLTVFILILAALTIFLIIKNLITKPINNLVKAADNLSNGDTNSYISDDYRGEMGTLARAFQNISNSINEQVRSAQAIADGDLTVNINIRSERDMLGNALRHLRYSLNEMVSKISDVAGNAEHSVYDDNIPELNAAKRGISANDLSNLIAEINIQIKTGANKVSETNIVSESISHDAETGKTQMDLLIQAVNEITSASQNISKVIKSIDDVAFKTNILALNASVEAARAGQSGASFAVVADEVRGLASISAKAADESGSLVENSIIKAREGAKIAEATREALETMINGIIKTNQLVSEINDMMNNQAQIIEHINSGIALLQKMVSRFKLQK